METVAEIPNPMPFSSARILEFEALRELLNAYASSELGRARVGALEPSCDRQWISVQQELVAEVLEFLRIGSRFDFSGLVSPATLLEKARIAGTALETAEIRDILILVDRAAQWRKVVVEPPANMKMEWKAVAALSADVADFSALLRFFQNKILPDGTLDDRASSELGRIRREIEKQKRAIQESLRGYLRRLLEGGAVQDELITIRGERFVIPVKVEQKRRIHGVVHGASSSGQTVFVEPMETIEQNNELVRLLEEELAEIHRILLEMTQRISARAEPIGTAQDALEELELQFAKARFAEDYNCVEAKLSGSQPDVGNGTAQVESAAPAVQRTRSEAKGRGPDPEAASRKPEAASLVPDASARLLLHNARHPLLERSLKARGVSVVPVSLELEGKRRQLIITGPNTGGKTVTLKTAGLLSLMARSGLPVPADRADVPVFDAVLADIGDYQSIEQNLSTFSAHVTNIDFISRTATAHSLVLLDELGSATDPEEGAALAVAIAGHFREIGCMSVISTHHTSLKVFGANSPGVLNAAVGLDEATLKPTYQLKTGVPGASAGISTAQRLGLNPEIIRSARARLGTQARDVGEFLDQLHEQLRDLERERAIAQKREEDLGREIKRLEAEGQHEQRQKTREFEKKLESVLRDFEYHA